MAPVVISTNPRRRQCGVGLRISPRQSESAMQRKCSIHCEVREIAKLAYTTATGGLLALYKPARLLVAVARYRPHLGQVEVVEVDPGRDAGGQQGVDERGVVAHAVRVHRARPAREQPRPADAEAVVLPARRRRWVWIA